MTSEARSRFANVLEELARRLGDELDFPGFSDDWELLATAKRIAGELGYPSPPIDVADNPSCRTLTAYLPSGDVAAFQNVKWLQLERFINENGEPVRFAERRESDCLAKIVRRWAYVVSNSSNHVAATANSQTWPHEPLDERQRTILDLFKALEPGEGLTPGDIADRLARKLGATDESVIRRDLEKLVAAGVPLLRRASGKRKPFYLDPDSR